MWYLRARLTPKLLSLVWSGSQEERKVDEFLVFCFFKKNILNLRCLGSSKWRYLRGNCMYRYDTCKNLQQQSNKLTAAIIVIVCKSMNDIFHTLSHVLSVLLFCLSSIMLAFVVLGCASSDSFLNFFLWKFLVCSGEPLVLSKLFYSPASNLPSTLSHFSGILGGRRDKWVSSVWTWSQKLWIEVLFCFLESLEIML